MAAISRRGPRRPETAGARVAAAAVAAASAIGSRLQEEPFFNLGTHRQTSKHNADLPTSLRDSPFRESAIGWSGTPRGTTVRDLLPTTPARSLDTTAPIDTLLPKSAISSQALTASTLHVPSYPSRRSASVSVEEAVQHFRCDAAAIMQSFLLQSTADTIPARRTVPLLQFQTLACSELSTARTSDRSSPGKYAYVSKISVPEEMNRSEVFGATEAQCTSEPAWGLGQNSKIFNIDGIVGTMSEWRSDPKWESSLSETGREQDKSNEAWLTNGFDQNLDWGSKADDICSLVAQKLVSESNQALNEQENSVPWSGQTWASESEAVTKKVGTISSEEAWAPKESDWGFNAANDSKGGFINQVDSDWGFNGGKTSFDRDQRPDGDAVKETTGKSSEEVWAPKETDWGFNSNLTPAVQSTEGNTVKAPSDWNGTWGANNPFCTEVDPTRRVEQIIEEQSSNTQLDDSANPLGQGVSGSFDRDNVWSSNDHNIARNANTKRIVPSWNSIVEGSSVLEMEHRLASQYLQRSGTYSEQAKAAGEFSAPQDKKYTDRIHCDRGIHVGLISPRIAESTISNSSPRVVNADGSIDSGAFAPRVTTRVTKRFVSASPDSCASGGIGLTTNVSSIKSSPSRPIDDTVDEVTRHLLCARSKIEAVEHEFAQIMSELSAYSERVPAVCSSTEPPAASPPPTGSSNVRTMRSDAEYFSIGTPLDAKHDFANTSTTSTTTGRQLIESMGE